MRKQLFPLTAGFFLTAPVFAQSTPATTYEFMVVVEMESQASSTAKIIFAPAFQGKTEVPIDALPGSGSSKYWPTYQHNLKVLTQYLLAATAAGLELATTSSSQVGQQYLFRWAKK